jgi:hypothetical protein
VRRRPAARPRSAGRQRSAPNAPAEIAWHLLSVFAIVIFASELALGTSIRELPADRRNFVAGVALAHTLVALIFRWRTPVDLRGRAARLIGALAIAYGGLAFGLLMFDAFYTRAILLAAGFASAGLAIVPSLLPRLVPRLLLPGLALGVALLFAAGLLLKQRSAGPESVAWRSRTVNSAFHPVHMSITERLLPSDVSGGAVQPVGSGFIIAVGDGTLHFLEDLTTSAPLTVRTLPYRVPINGDVYAAAAGPGALAGTAALEWHAVFDARPCLRLRTGPRSPSVRAGPHRGRGRDGRLAAAARATCTARSGQPAAATRLRATFAAGCSSMT